MFKTSTTHLITIVLKPEILNALRLGFLLNVSIKKVRSGNVSNPLWFQQLSKCRNKSIAARLHFVVFITNNIKRNVPILMQRRLWSSILKKNLKKTSTLESTLLEYSLNSSKWRMVEVPCTASRCRPVVTLWLDICFIVNQKLDPMCVLRETTFSSYLSHSKCAICGCPW